MNDRRRILKSKQADPKHSNSIRKHEESIALASEATSNRFELVQQRLRKYQKKKKHANLRNRKQEWIEKFRDLEREKSNISKQFDDISSSPLFLKATSITTDKKNSIKGSGQPQISIRKFRTEISGVLSEPNARERLLVKTKNVKERYNQIVDELKINRREETDAQLQGSDNIFNDEKVKPSKTTNKIPMEVLVSVNAIKTEFLRIGLESKEVASTLETKLSHVVSECLASLSKLINDGQTKCEQNSSNTSLTLWDEDSRLVLRNSMTQYQKANMNEKRRVLQSISKQVRRSSSVTKAELDRLMDEKHVRLKNKEKRQTASAIRSQAIRTALDQIRSIRSSIIDDIAGGLYSIVYDEIAEERTQRLQLLTDEKDIGEEKSRDEKVRRQDKERQEHDRSFAKRQGEILAAKEKATEYLKTKREELRMTQILKLMEQNDEEEARLGRLVANRERVDFRRQEKIKKDIQNKDRLERSYRAELEREEKLKAIASSVPYYNTIQNIKSDLLRSTASRMNDFYEPSSESGLTISQQGLSKLTGFTDDKVFSCPKFRLAHQLHERGVASTAYSCAVVERLIQREDKPF